MVSASFSWLVNMNQAFDQFMPWFHRETSLLHSTQIVLVVRTDQKYHAG